MPNNRELEQRAKDAESDRDNAFKETKATSERLFETRNKSKEVIENSCRLVSSIKATPFELLLKERKIKSAQKKFEKADKVIRKNYARNGAALAAAVAGAGGVVGAFLKMKDSLTEQLRKHKGAGIILVLVVSFVGSLLAKALKRKNAEELEAFIQSCQMDADEARRMTLMTNEAIEQLNGQTTSITLLLDDLEPIKNAEFKFLDGETKARLGVLVNNTLGLAQLLNAEAEDR